MTPVIDLSHWNEGDSAEKVRDSGVVGVIHKCTESTNYVDPTYEPRRQIAEDVGLLWGAYHFLRPGDMVRQAQWFVDHVGNFDGMLLAADHEDPGVSLSDLKEFLRTVADLTGHSPVIYSGHVLKEQLGNKYDAELAEYRLWLAHYTSGEPSWPVSTWENWWLWQFTDQGSVPGMSGAVDLNHYYAGDSNTARLVEEWSGDKDREPTPPKEKPVVTVALDISISNPDDIDLHIIINGEEL